MNEFVPLLVINVVLAGATIAYWRKSNPDSTFVGLGKYIAILLTGWGGFSIIVGLFLAFDDLENSKVFSYQLILRDVIVVLRFFAAGLVLTFCLVRVSTHLSKQRQIQKKN
jgi:Na+-translocating ferredoxin:NAD+ oxidoreductase RnfE subunit